MDIYEIFKDWKEEYGEVRFIVLDGIEFYFRLITREEYNTLRKVESNNFVVDEMVAELCVLEPVVDDWSDEIYAGFTNTLARTILEESLIIPGPHAGDRYIEDLVTRKYNEISINFEQQMPAIILKAFPAYKLEEVKSWPLTRQVDVYAQATWMLNEIEGYGISFSEDN